MEITQWTDLADGNAVGTWDGHVLRVVATTDGRYEYWCDDQRGGTKSNPWDARKGARWLATHPRGHTAARTGDGTNLPNPRRTGTQVRFVEHPDKDVRRESAIKLIRAALELDLYHAGPTKRESHLIEVLDIGLWKLSAAEADDYHQLRFRSAAACELQARGAGPSEVQHEHVWRKKPLIMRLLAAKKDNEEVTRILAPVIGCVVTKAEHHRLSILDRSAPHIDGWDRYRRSGITVIDTLDGSVFVDGRMSEEPYG